MENIIIIVLTSTVISALISGLISSRMKGKELEVKLKLEEKNKWIENISQAHKDYMNNTTECVNSLTRDFIDRRDSEGTELIYNSYIKAQNTLIFFMYQSEYVLSDIQETVDIMTENTSELEIRINNNSKSMRDEIGAKELSRLLAKIEVIIQENNNSFSKKLGTMIRKEKEQMTFEIIKRPLIGNIFFRK